MIKLVGLANEERNGCVGVCMGFDDERERYKVRLMNGENEVAVRSRNVRQVVSEARVEGTSQENLNGRVAASAVYDSESGRYHVEGIYESPLAIKPEHLVLPPDTRVTVVGVNSRPELNGLAGTVLSSDGKERYTVQLAHSGEQLKLRFGAVVSLHGNLAARE